METNFNLGSLKIVQASLMEYFKKALENIDSNLILLREERKVPTNHDAIELLSKSQKTLDMIGLKGISRILLLCEEALREVREVKFDSKKTIEILELASQIVKNSSIYLQKLVNTGFDQPTKFFNEYSEMANLLGKEVFIKDLFYPKLELSADTNEQMQNDLRIGVFINQSSKKNLKTHIEKVSVIMENKIPEVFKVLDAYGDFYSEQEKHEYQNVCKSLYEAFDFIQKLKLNKNYYILFGIYKLYICILSPIFNNSFNSYISERKQIIKENLNRINKTVNNLLASIIEMEDGEKTGNIRVDEETIKEILFEMIFAVGKNQELKQMPVYKDLESFFDITFYIEQLSKNSSIEDLNMISEDRILEIERSFLDLKEDFNLLTNKDKNSQEYSEYSQIIIKCLNNIAELISSTSNVRELTVLVKELKYGFEMLRSEEATLTENVKREISLALVLIDYGINSFIKNIVDSRFIRDYEKQAKVQIDRLRAAFSNNEMELKVLPLPRLDIVSQKADEKKTFAKIFEQLNNDLTKIEETLDYFLKNEGENIDEISSIYKPLVSMKGIFSIIGKPELGKVINNIAEPWKKIIDGQNSNFNLEELRESIALISGLSLLIKAYVEENEVAAEELHNNLMKIFYKHNNEELVVDVNEDDKVEEKVEETPIEEEFTFELEDLDNLEVEEKQTLDLVESISPKEIMEVLSTNGANAVFIESTNDPDLADVFLMEAEEVLGFLGESIDKLDRDISDREELTNVRRFFHTLKGSGRMVGLEFMGEAGWMTEQTLNKCLAGDIDFNPEIFALIKEMKSNFEIWIEELKKNNQVTVDLVSIKRKFLVVNPVLTNHVEISLDAKQTEEKGLEEPSFGFGFEEKAEVKPAEEEFKPLEESEFNFSFEEKAEVKPTEEEFKAIEEPSFGFGFEEKAEVKHAEEEFKPLEESEFNFSFEEKAEVKPTEEEFKPLEESEFNFSFEEKAEVKHAEEEFKPLEESEFNFSFEEKAEVKHAEEEFKPLEESEFNFSFEEKAEVKHAEEEFKPLEESEFNFSFEEKAEVKPTEEEFKPLEESEFNFSFEEKAEVKHAEEEFKSIEEPSFGFGFEEKAEVKPIENNIVVEEEEDYLLIEGNKVSKALYEIFNQESLEHITSLKEFVHQDYSEPVMLSKEFMRHAHTLSSISASVHLKKISKIANNLEKISLLTKERKVALSQVQMNVIRHVVDNLDLFKEIDTSEHNAYYESLIEKLKALVEEVTVDNSEKENISVVEEVVSHIEEKEEQSPDSNMSEEDIIKLAKEIKTDVQSSVMSEVNLLFKNNKDLLIEVLMNNNKEVVSELNEKIVKLEKTIETLREQQEKQQEREKLLNKELEVTKNDIRTLASIVKKKYAVPFYKNDELNQENVQVNLDSIDTAKEDSQQNSEITNDEELVVSSSLVSLEESGEFQNIFNEEELKKLRENSFDSEEEVLLHASEDSFFSNVVEEKEESSVLELLETPKEENLNFILEEKQSEEILDLESEKENAPVELSLDVVGEESIVFTLEENKVNESGDSIVENLVFSSEEEIISDVEALESIIESKEETEYFEVNAEPVKKIESVSVNEKQENLSQEDMEIQQLLSEHESINHIFEDKVASVEDEIDDDIFEISKVEAEEMLENINPILEKINTDGLSANEGLELKRYLHTLKGSLRMAGANKIGMLAHRLESLIEYAETRKLNFYKIKALLEKEVNKIVFLLKDPKQVLDDKKTAWLDQIVNDNVVANKNVVKQEEKSVVLAESVSKETVKEVKKETKQYIRVLSNVLDTAINDAGEIRLARTSLENTTLNNKKSLIELKTSSSKLAKMVKEVEVQAETQIQAQSTKIDEKSENFDPLEFDRFTRLQELTRLMVEAIADIEETVVTLDSNAKIQDNTINEQAIVTNNLLAELMKVRLVNIESISDRFYKIARNTSKELNKRVYLEIVGEKTDVDKFLLDKIISPIEHILRNSIAHGIELPNERVNKRKQPLGKITMDISTEGNYTIIKITDDGAGINIDKVRTVAINKGLIKESDELSKDEIVNLIFQSGFSTADSVSQVAGRGVGMDVVKNEILAIGGSIKINTEKDLGSTFTLIIPMDVATNQSMLCIVAGKLLAIPALLIEEVVSIKEMQLKKAYEGNSIKLANGSYPLYYAGHLMGLWDSNLSPEIKSYNSLIRVKYGAESIVLHFDKLITTTEILIKPLGSIYGKVTGLLGVTVLGDGRQGVVINPIQLLEHYEKNIKTIHIDSNNTSEVASTSLTTKITVMVVDDSITVRRASSKILERNNFNVILAKDGEEALEQLQVIKPNIILSDIEMPRMDGFEFVKNVRSMNKFNDVPIIIITSRTADKHQKHAFDLGANDFLGKPYKEEDLMLKIEQQLSKIKEV